MQPFDYIVQKYYLCQYHFQPDDIDIRGKKKCILPGKLPSIFENINNDDNDTSECLDVNTTGTNINNIESTSSSSTFDNDLNSIISVQNKPSIGKLTEGTLPSSSTIYDE